MKRTVIGGVALALVAVVAVYVGEALNLGLPTPLLGIAAGGVLALAPGGHKLGRLVGLDAETEDVARRCGDALGIALYGVDIIHHRGRPWVVDLSSFPGFKGVPEAAARLTALIDAQHEQPQALTAGAGE